MLSVAQSKLIWLDGDLVAYEPTEQPESVWNDDERRFTFSGKIYREWKDDWSQFNPHPIDSVLERECPTCEGKGKDPTFKSGDDFGGWTECSDCIRGTQKRRIVSVTLKTLKEIGDNLKPDKPGEDPAYKLWPFVIKGKRLDSTYLIIAHTEAVE